MKNILTDKKLKVLILSHSSELSGAERSMVNLFDYWAKKRYVVPHFIIRRPLKNLAPELRKRGWSYTPIHYTNWSQRNPSAKAESFYKGGLFNSAAVFAIEKVIQEEKPDVIMTNTIVSPWAAVAAYFQKVPHVWFVREYGDVDHRHTFELGREKMLQDIGTLSSMVVTNSKTLAKHIEADIGSEKITTLYNPFDLDELKAESLKTAINPFKAKDSLKLVITGKITPTKGQTEAAEAVAMLIKQGFNVELCVIGKPVEPNDDRPLEEVIKKNNLEDKVHLIGHQANPLSILKYADVGIMASYREAFGRVTFEYMAIGLPVVGASSGATPEMIDEGKNGYLYNHGDAENLAEKLSHYAKNTDLANEHGAAARKKAESMMSSKYNADSLFTKIAAIAQEGSNNLVQPLNFAHRWLEYPSIAQQYIDDSGVVDLKHIIYMRLRHQAKLGYLFIANLGSRRKRKK
jgi:glycosyltransferase involved in cell wall biosynthesis